MPGSATPGDYRIRWTFQQFSSSPAQQVVQEWAVVVDSTIIVPGAYSTNVQGMIDKLRMLLRDQCLGGEETVELDVEGERMIVRLDDLWETLEVNPG